MASATLRRIRAKIWPEPLPAPGTFDGQTVLITGATSGLGLAAAKHFASLGATIIITSRSVAKGEPAKRDIEQSAGVAEGRVHLMELDMSRYSSCRSFINELKGSKFGRRGINVAVLNAGIINSEYAESPEGWYVNGFVLVVSIVLLKKKKPGNRPSR